MLPQHCVRCVDELESYRTIDSSRHKDAIQGDRPTRIRLRRRHNTFTLVAARIAGGHSESQLCIRGHPLSTEFDRQPCPDSSCTAEAQRQVFNLQHAAAGILLRQNRVPEQKEQSQPAANGEVRSMKQRVAI